MLLEMKMIAPVTHSGWAALIVCVRKSNGKLRVCADFSTGLNRALESFDYPLPVPEDIFATLTGGAVFSQIDLSDSYLQIELSDESKKMVVINTHRGVQIQRPYREVFLCKARDSVSGLHCGQEWQRGKSRKVEAIKSMVEPKNVGQLRTFLGMITYYAAFMPTMKDLCGPLYALLKKHVKWGWTSKQQTAFDKLKKALWSELNLAHYDPRQKIVVAADSCDYGIGCRLRNNHSHIEKEALGIVFAVKKFHKYVFGRKFLLETNHKPLLAIFGDKKGVPVYSANRLMRWATILLGYNFDIEYVNTTKFGQADGLSRLMQKHHMENEDIVIASVENDVCTLLKECIRRLPLTVDDVE
ncbi:hypothetical protein ANCCEY_13514 [Ancylostoma ceylanicum]|uniref:RNA-directed DNA polymerase n=1 Tax=Ancylostoma ceylanicum TaxID=53326 RepID=A0A0D6L7D2_9BILA|nr:hypothetical protein ANCCEY_13514 [Ancylostoma ceylanicum]